MKGPLLLGAVAAVQLIAHSANGAPTIMVSDAHVRPIPATLSMTAGYLTVRNTGERPDTLTGISCACAAEVSAHETMDMGGTSSMQASGAVVIPAHGAVVFMPGGRHLMLMGVKGGLRPGQTLKMTLTFARAGKVTVPFLGRN